MRTFSALLLLLACFALIQGARSVDWSAVWQDDAKPVVQWLKDGRPNPEPVGEGWSVK